MKRASDVHGKARKSAVRASRVLIANRGGVLQKVWIFDSDGSAPRSLTLVPDTTGTVSLENQHSYFLYSVGFGKMQEWNASNPDEPLNPEALDALFIDVDAYPRSEVRWDVVSGYPPDIVQGNDQISPATFTIDAI